ncbi:MAG: class I SAM-dependent methyltransferase [Nevskiaceae bacterium]|nr:MAG: class I SAM-dependent methyltransferase [Nevskiaceae bacterium]TAM32904.1 MAG: class I SAM-dependent methyltransferase [Nevskiaceae bacterium]
MTASLQSANEQSVLWNGQAGRAWVEAQAVLDQMFKPLEELLVEVALAQPRERVLDVGCGTGSTTLAVARSLGGRVDCVGVDISEPMIVAARARAEREATPASFVLADAEAHAFEPASFDLIVSRFGVMFFEDSVRAFANLRRAAKAGGELRFIAWRSPAENPFMTAAERAVAPLLPDLPPRQPNAPGQFAFADPQRVRRILEESGWQAIEIRPLDVRCRLPEKDLMGYLARLGPLGRVLPELDEKTRSRVLEVARAAFEPYVQGDWVSYDAACWSVGARAP